MSQTVSSQTPTVQMPRVANDSAVRERWTDDRRWFGVFYLEVA
jgi:hypothetical protein